jgi:predicted AAA+ superfamily ATPase
MLIGIEGNVGSGKTILLVKYLKNDASNSRKIFANLKLSEIPYEEFNIDDFLNNRNNDRLNNATIGLDEITMYMDCRTGSAKQNLLMGYLVLQSRKRGIDIYYTTQDLDLVD